MATTSGRAGLAGGGGVAARQCCKAARGSGAVAAGAGVPPGVGPGAGPGGGLALLPAAQPGLGRPVVGQGGQAPAGQGEARVAPAAVQYCLLYNCSWGSTQPAAASSPAASDTLSRAGRMLRVVLWTVLGWRVTAARCCSRSGVIKWEPKQRCAAGLGAGARRPAGDREGERDRGNCTAGAGQHQGNYPTQT